MRRRVEVLVECTNCKEQFRAEADIEDCDNCGGHHPARGTLTGDWLVRWIKSHIQPRVTILQCEHVS